MSDKLPIELDCNGERRTIAIDQRALLIEVVRDELNCPGSRIGCLTGDCGACSVLIDGTIAKSCLVLAAACHQREIRTIEGIRSPLLSRIQAAFVQHKGFQCGYCTSGMILVAFDLLSTTPNATRDEIRNAISGNLCRCTGYEAIIDSIEGARDDTETD